MENKKTTIHDIAKKLNTTASTVSRALRDHPRISDSTKKLVFAMAEEMNYQPNSIAAALRKGRSNLIGILVPTIDRNFFGSVVRGLEEVLTNSGYNVIISQSNDSIEKEKLNIKALLEAQVDGIFASYAKETTSFEHFDKIIKQGIPLIFFDRMQDSMKVDSVVIDDYKAGFKATEHLIEQGCTRIAHFAGPGNVSIYRDRQAGYEDALKKYNLASDPSLIFKSDLKFESGQDLGERILNMPPLPDGIFSSSDYAAMGAMEVLKKRGIKIPNQIAIVGFSNEAFTSLVNPALTTVEQHSKKMGEEVAHLFLERVNSKEPIFTFTKTVLPSELIIRDSSIKSGSQHIGNNGNT
ncbi:MAG: LacI family DNA-binding transcriptional regulator [Balneolaceae bacterium]